MVDEYYKGMRDGAYQFSNMDEPVKNSPSGYLSTLPASNRTNFKTGPIRRWNPSTSLGQDRYEVSPEMEERRLASETLRENKYKQIRENEQEEFDLDKKRFQLKLFEYLNQTDPITGQNNFILNRDRYNLFSMTPEAQAALNERMRGNLGLAEDDTSINTSINTGNEDQRLLPRDPEYADYHRYQRAQKRALDQAKIPPRPSPNYIPIY